MGPIVIVAISAISESQPHNQFINAYFKNKVLFYQILTNKNNFHSYTWTAQVSYVALCDTVVLLGSHVLQPNHY